MEACVDFVSCQPHDFQLSEFSVRGFDFLGTHQESFANRIAAMSRIAKRGSDKTQRFALVDAQLSDEEILRMVDTASTVGFKLKVCVVCSWDHHHLQQDLRRIQDLGLQAVLGGVNQNCRITDFTATPVEGFSFDRAFLDEAAGEPRAACALNAIATLASDLGVTTFASRVSRLATMQSLANSKIDYISCERNESAESTQAIQTQLVQVPA